MADKRIDFPLAPAFAFMECRGILEETGIEPGDTCDFTIQIQVGTIPGGFPTPFSVDVTAIRAPAPAGGTISVLGGGTTLSNMTAGTIKEAHVLVQAGATPGPYAVELTVVPFGFAPFAQVFTFDVPEQS